MEKKERPGETADSLRPTYAYAPDLARILRDRAICREPRASRGVVDRHADPGFVVRPRFGGAALGGDVGREVFAMLITIGAGDGIDDRLVAIPLRDVSDDAIEGLARCAVRGEEEDVLAPHLLGDLDVRAVVRADDHRAVHHRFHATRPRGLGAGGRNLLGDFGGRK